MARKRARKRARKQQAVPYAYGIGPNELSEETGKLMGLKQYRRVAVEAGDFGHKVRAKQDTDGTWRLVVGCEDHTLSQWEQRGEGLIESNYYSAVDDVTTEDTAPNLASGPKVDYIDSVTVNFENGDSEYVDLDELDESVKEAIVAKAIENRGASALDDEDDETPRGPRLWATLQAVIAELKKL